jgi:hypothetical protein
MLRRGPSTFKQSDLVRALRAARIAGVEVDRVEIDKSGRIVVVMSNAPVVTAIADSRE